MPQLFSWWWPVTVALMVTTVSSWTFFSSHEAVTVFAPDSLCMGECVEHWGQDMCVFAWNRSMAKCHNNGKPTLHYRTIDNDKCLSNCGKFDEERYEWCAISDNNWNKCSRDIALVGRRTVASNNIYAVCKDKCAKRGSKYPWCHTVDGSWNWCTPNAYSHTFNYPTNRGTKCAGRCLLDDEVGSCFDENGDWSTCNLNPIYDETLNNFARTVRLYCPRDVYDTPGGHTRCNRRQSRVRHPRAADDYTNNELYFECDATVDTVLASHAASNPTVTVRTEDPNNMITNDPNPILSYILMPTVSYFQDESPNVDLPLALQALVTTHTLLPVGSRRDRFTSSVDNNYNSMDRTLTHVNFDERGHILASRLGGPMERFNIFPQPWQANRGRNSMWFGLEEDIDNFVRGHSNRYVRFTAVLSYGTDDSHVLSHRPSAILVRVRAYENGVHVDLFGNDITSRNPSPTENMYFSNDPDQSCAPLPAPPRRNG